MKKARFTETQIVNILKLAYSGLSQIMGSGHEELMCII